ncbi:Lsr2 family protein [Rhodococcus aetherivorans]|nr:Lsr2 family protein [Rhodococcus aetherivorans]
MVEYTDDLTNESFEEGQGETLKFGLNGTDYEIDLTNENIDKLNDLLAPYIEAARKVGAPRRGRPSGSGTTTRRSTASGRSKEELANIREWAAKHGHKVSERGRISQSVQDAYDEAHKK